MLTGFSTKVPGAKLNFWVARVACHRQSESEPAHSKSRACAAGDPQRPRHEGMWARDRGRAGDPISAARGWGSLSCAPRTLREMGPKLLFMSFRIVQQASRVLFEHGIASGPGWQVVREGQEPNCGAFGMVKCTLSFVGTDKTQPSCCPPACLEPGALKGFEKLQTLFTCPTPECKITVSASG